MKKTTSIGLMLAASIGLSVTADAASLAMKDWPLPVQAYVLKEAVGVGVEEPFKLSVDPVADFSIPAVPQSDLNGDGFDDYQVQLCQFDAYQFRTNGYACAFGNLILSLEGYGYSYLNINGVIKDARQGAVPEIIVEERCFDDVCSDYLHDVVYRIDNDQNGALALVMIEKCKTDTCLFDN